MPELNPEVMRWARETAGLTPEQAAQKLGINPAHGLAAVDRLAVLESGTATPSRPMLVKMAKRYRRPLLAFYLAEPPSKGSRGEDFRRLPEPLTQDEEALVYALVRDLQARQSLLKASLEAAGEARPLPFIGSMTQQQGVSAVAAAIQQTLGFDREAFRAQPHPKDAFAYLRSLTEASGIFVLLAENLGSWHTTLSLDAFRGLALADPVAPFVAVNANDSLSAWSFTLLHELAHLWLGAPGLSGGYTNTTLERFCNDTASHLLPKAETSYASRSRRTDRVGEPLIRLVDRMLHESHLSVSKAALVLGVKPPNVYRLLDQALRAPRT